MRNLNIDIKRVEIQRSFLSENKVGYKIYFRLDEIIKNIYVEFPIMNSEQVVRTLLSEIKKTESILVDDTDDVLQSIVLVKINEQEEIEPKLIDFFSKINGKVKSLKEKKTADNYIDMYNQLMKEKLEL